MNRAVRWAWIVALVAAVGAALVLAYVLTLSVQGAQFERHFPLLFRANVVVALLLLAVIGSVVVRLALRIRRGKFGSRLLIKLAGIFALVGLLPGLVIYTVSYQFVQRSIEVWFDDRLASALDAGLALGKDTLDALATDLAAQTRVAALRVADIGPAPLPLELERLREQIGARELALVNAGGQALVSVGGGPGAGPPERPSASLMRQARLTGAASQIEGLDEDTLAAAQAAGTAPRATLRALARVPSHQITLARPEERYLLVVQSLPRALTLNALAVQSAYSEYQQRALARDALARVYIGTLTLSLVLAVFVALLLAILLGNQLVRPLILLAAGVRDVAAGDLTAKPVFPSGDELGGLTRSFAAMTAQLADARVQVERGVAQLEGARTRLQTILDTLSAGVIVFDAEGWPARSSSASPCWPATPRPASATNGRKASS